MTGLSFFSCFRASSRPILFRTFFKPHAFSKNKAGNKIFTSGFYCFAIPLRYDMSKFFCREILFSPFSGKADSPSEVSRRIHQAFLKYLFSASSQMRRHPSERFWGVGSFFTPYFPRSFSQTEFREYPVDDFFAQRFSRDFAQLIPAGFQVDGSAVQIHPRLQSTNRIPKSI